MDSILIFEIDRIYKINLIFYIPGFHPPAIDSRSSEAGGEETGYMQSASRKNLSPISMLCAIH
jgi:hypothetical protein